MGIWAAFADKHGGIWGMRSICTHIAAPSDQSELLALLENLHQQQHLRITFDKSVPEPRQNGIVEARIGQVQS
jgi:hypothetical protein